MKLERILFYDGSFFEINSKVYEGAVRKLEKEGLTTSDAQGCVEAQLLGKYRNLIIRLSTVHGKALLSIKEFLDKAEAKDYPVLEIKKSLTSVASQNCSPKDVSNLDIFLNVLLKIEDSLTSEELERIAIIRKELKGIIQAPTGWKTIL